MFGRKDDWYERSYSDDRSDVDEKPDLDKNTGFFDFVLVFKFLCLMLFLSLVVFICFQFYKSFDVKVTDVQRSVVGVQIYDEYQRDDYYTYVSTGKALVPVHHDAVYKITFDYDDMKFVIDDEKVYAKYYDNIGRFIDATLEVTALSDGNMKYRIVELEPELKGGDSIE